MKTLSFAISLLFVGPLALARTVNVDGPQVRLSDLIEGVDNDVVVVRAPPPGSRRTVSRRQVLALGDFSQRKLPEQWTVVTRKQTLTCVDYRKQVSASLMKALTKGLRVVSVNCSRDLVVPMGTLRLEAHLLRSSRQAGRLSAKVEISATGWNTRNMVVAVEIDGRLPVVVANGSFSHGQALDQAAFRVEERLASELPADALSSLSQLEGFLSTSRINRDAIVQSRMLRAIPLVRRGSSVTISVVMDGLRLSSRGIVRQDGGRGEMVSVIALNSRKLLQARVVDEKTVAVEL